MLELSDNQNCQGEEGGRSAPPQNYPGLLASLGAAELLPKVDLAKSLSLTHNTDWYRAQRYETPPSRNLAALPDFRLDGGQDRAGRPPMMSEAPSIKYDLQNRITAITYPGGKTTRYFDRDAEGNLNRVTTKDDKGVRTYIKEEGHWYCNVDGMKLKVPGSMSLSSHGDFTIQIGSDRSFQTQRPDGSLIEERTNAAGARVALNSSGQVKRITRQDGSSVEALWQSGEIAELVERQAGGSKALTWKREGQIFVSDTKPRCHRLNLQLHENGNTSFTGTDGFEHVIRGNGAELLEGPGKARFAFDKQGRILSIEYPDGKKSMGFTYAGDTSELSCVSIKQRQPDKTRIYTKEGSSDSWTITNASNKKVGSWKGQAILSTDGIYSVRAAVEKTGSRRQTDEEDAEDGSNSKRSNTKTPERSWQSLRPDGSKVNEQIAANGSRAQFDSSGRVLSIRRADGSAVDARYNKDRLDQVIETATQPGQKITWSRQKDNTWICDESGKRDVRRNLTITKDGDINFTDLDGTRHLIALSGTTQLSKKDGSKVEIDNKGLVRKVSINKGDCRTFDWTDGVLTKVTDITRAGLTCIWERKAGELESRKNIRVGGQGDLRYDNPDGTSVIERSNFARVRLNADGKVTDVTQPNGSTRTFSYNINKELITITDCQKTKKGDYSQTWIAQTNADGRPNSTFVSPGKDGKQRIRDIIGIADNGDYQYRGANGKLHFAPADRLRHRTGSFDSGDIEEARSNLEDMARSHKVNMKRLTRYMDQLEKRCRQGASDGMKVPGEEQIARTYETMSRLLEGSGHKNFLNEKQRIKVCEQAMQNIAFPKHIDQGQNPTCNITTGEIYTASRRPERYADLMKQIAFSGKFEYKDGKGKTHTVRPPNRGLFPGYEEAHFNIDRAHKDGTRSWASKIFQVTAINSVTPGYSGGDPSFGIDRILSGTRRVSGDKMPYVGHRGGASLQMVPESTLWRLKKEGNLPCGVVTMGFAHVQVIHDVRKRNGRTEVWLGNQWGEANDPGWISMRRLHQIQGGGGGW